MAGTFQVGLHGLGRRPDRFTADFNWTGDSASVRLTTVAPKYDWINTRQMRVLATVNLTTARIHVESFMQ